MHLSSELNQLDRTQTKMLGLIQVKQLALVAMMHRRIVHRSIVRKKGTNTTIVISIMGGMMGIRMTVSSKTLASQPPQLR